jgi:hypothetical protein
MKYFLRLLIVPLLFSSVALAQMQLKFSNDFEHQSYSPTLESNSELILPNTTISPSAAMDFYKGLFILGLLADVSFPMGDEFKHISGTAFSGHVVAGYLLSPEFLIALKAGYVNFGKQTSEDVFGNYEDTFSQIPILIGGYYIFPNGSGFKPYIGLALGVFFQTYAVKWTDVGQSTPYLDKSFNNTGFGIVPAVGFYYMLGSTILQASAEYNLLLSDIPTAEYTYDYTILGKTNGTNSIAQDTDSETSGKASFISVNFGVSFPLGK